MRVWLCLAAAGLLLSGCAMLGVSSGSADKEVPARGLADNKDAPWYARSNNGGCAAWEQNAYHYECDPNANY
jgi:hypothetical protein